MGYYVRVFSKGAEPAKLGIIRERLAKKGLTVQVLTDDAEDQWEAAVLAHSDGREFAAVERNPVAPGALGADELTEMIDEVSECEPASAAGWRSHRQTIQSPCSRCLREVGTTGKPRAGWFRGGRTILGLCSRCRGGSRTTKKPRAGCFGGRRTILRACDGWCCEVGTTKKPRVGWFRGGRTVQSPCDGWCREVETTAKCRVTGSRAVWTLCSLTPSAPCPTWKAQGRDRRRLGPNAGHNG